MLSKITSLLYCVLAFLLAFGSANIFDLDSIRYVSEAVSSQNSYSPFLFAACSLISLFDKRVLGSLTEMGRILFPLLVLIISIFLGDFFYDIAGIETEYYYYLKLVTAFAGFIIFSIYFTEHPDVLILSLNIFTWTCSLIVIAYYLGLLNQFSYFSNGRLWMFGENPNSFSFLMGVGALVHLFFLLENGKYRLLRLLSVLAIISFIVLSGSRGSFIMCLFSMCIILIPFIKRHLFASIILALVIASVASMYIQSVSDQVSFFERMSTLTQEDERQTLLSNSFSLFIEKPLFGFGRHGYVVERLIRFNDSRDSHNVIVSVLAMGGIVGGISILAFFLILFRKTIQSARKSLIPLSLFAYVFLISMKTGEILTYSMMWYSFAVVFAYSSRQGKYN